MYPTDKKEVKELGKLYNDIELHFYYSSLISTKRSKEAQKKIREILNKTSNINYRIREIEEIDRQDRDAHPDIYEKGSARRVKPIILEYEEQNRKKSAIKPQKVKAPGFFAYLFTLRHYLREFSQKTLTIIPKFLGLIYKFSPVFFSEIKNIEKYINLYAEQPITFLVENSWQQLEKDEYNLLYTFQQFIKEFRTLTKVIKNKSLKTQDIIKVMDRAAPPFLELIYQKSNRDKIISVISETLMTNINYKKLIPKLNELLHHLFDTEIQRRNFVQVVVASFVLYYKKDISLENIYQHYAISEIKSDSYICNEEVAIRIAQKIKEIIARLDEIEKSLFILKYVDDTQRIADIKNEYFRIFSERFINASIYFRESPNRINFYIDYFFSDLIRTLKLIVSGFLTATGKMFVGEFEIKNADKETTIRVFDPSLFSGDMAQMRELLQQIISYSEMDPYIHITSRSYDDFVINGVIDTPKEEQGLRLVNRGGELFYNLSERLTHYLLNHKTALDETNDAGKPENYKNTALDISEDKPRPLPYYFEVIKNKHLEEKTIEDTYSDIAFFTSNMAFLLGSSAINKIMKDKDSLIIEGEKLLKDKNRYLE